MNDQQQIDQINTGELWGLPLNAVHGLADELREFWKRFRSCFKTSTRDTSKYAYDYLTSQLRMETNRNFTEISRETGTSSQNLQHFMSNSLLKGSAYLSAGSRRDQTNTFPTNRWRVAFRRKRR